MVFPWDTPLAREFFRYAGAGGLAFVSDIALFLFLINAIGASPEVAAVAGYSVGLALVYLFSIRWVFAYRRLKRSAWVEFSGFAAIGCVGLLINVGVISFGVRHFALEPLILKVIATAVTFGFNFVARKITLFTRLSKAQR